MNRNRTRGLRLATMAVVVIAVFIGAVGGAGTGSVSGFGVNNIAAVCPLGYLETVFAGRNILPSALISFVVIAGLTVLLGRVFCGWICPVPLARRTAWTRMDSSHRAVHCTGITRRRSTG